MEATADQPDFLVVFKLSKVNCEIETSLETRVNALLHFPPAISRPNRRLPFFSKRRRSWSGEREPSEAMFCLCPPPSPVHLRPLSISGDCSEKLDGHVPWHHRPPPQPMLTELSAGLPDQVAARGSPSHLRSLTAAAGTGLGRANAEIWLRKRSPRPAV